MNHNPSTPSILVSRELLHSHFRRVPIALVVACALLGMMVSSAIAVVPVPSWTRVTPPNIPSVRYDSMMAFDSRRNVMILSGGLSFSSFVHDTYELTGGVWVPRNSANGQYPPFDGPLAYDTIRGETVFYCCGQTWVWDGTNWIRRNPAQQPPATGVTSAFDSSRGVTVLYAMDATTWEWDGTNWAQISTAHNPGPRATTMAFDSDRGKAVIFGGQQGSGWYNDIWEYDGYDWIIRPASGDVPTARGVNKLVYDTTTKHIIVFGGVNYDIGYFGDTWDWDGSSGVWTRRNPTNAPSPRNAPYAFDSSRGVTVLFGGTYSGQSSYLGDTWEWNDSAGTWTNTIRQSMPADSGGFAYDSVHNQIVSFGGSVNSAETWTFSSSSYQWTRKFPTTQPPEHSPGPMVFDSRRGVAVMFGGTGSNGIIVNDTWEWNGSNWTQRFPVNSPSPRTLHIMSFDSDRGVTVLFGGWYFDDTWEWDGTNWTQRFPAHKPAARFRQAMAYDKAHQKTLLFGGDTINGIDQDTWTWDGTDWTRLFPSASPPARKDHGMTYDESRNRIVMFGGTVNGSSANDTWEWDGANWNSILTPTSPPGGNILVYDSSRQQVLVWSVGMWAYVGAAVPPTDTTPPITNGNPPPGWQKSDFVVTLVCLDNPGGSGCKETKYRVDGGTWQTGNSVNITTDGDHAIEFYSIDNAGNIEAPKSARAKLDKTPPIFGNCPTGGPFLNNSGAQVVGPITYDASVAGLNSGLSMLTGSVDTSSVGTKIVTFKAVDNAGNTSMKSCNYNIIASATIQIVAALHTVGSGTNPGTNKSPLALDLRVYDKAVVGSPDPKDFGTTWNSGTRIVAPLALISGPNAVNIGGGTANQYNIIVPASPNSLTSGSYLVIGKATVDGQTVYVGSSTDPLTANSTTQRFLQVIKNASGKSMPATTTAVPGSLLLIVEPAYLEFTNDTELLPIVFESIDGTWSDVVQANPPEGFVSTPGALTVDVSTSQLKAVQFTVKDVGSAWTFTKITHRIKHKGQDRVITHNMSMVNKQKKK